MVEPRPAPRRGGVTGLALTSESRGVVIGILHRARLGDVARLALRGPLDELHLPLGRWHVTRGAIGGDVRPRQRESRRLVRSHHGRAVDEAPRIVATRAVGAELRAGYVGVTADARRIDLPELERLVTAVASGASVRALERE